jgi:hypothetical protein
MCASALAVCSCLGGLREVQSRRGRVRAMRIRFCKKYEKYVSAQHCEFFNEGRDCKYYGNTRWNRIKDLLADRTRPKQDVHDISKPFQCKLIAGEDQRRASQTA